MKPAPLPRRALRQLGTAVKGQPRQGAIQPSTAMPSAGTLGRYRMGRAGASTLLEERRHLESYQDWQTGARRAARRSGPVRFAAGMVSMTAARVKLRVEEMSETGDWQESTDERLVFAMAGYRNELLGQGPAELMRLHTWHYQIAGEACIVNVDDQFGNAQWLIVSMAAIDFDRPQEGMATVKLHPAGTMNDGMAIVVPRDQVFHYWMPDEEWLSMAVSPMTGAMDDLGRYEALSRRAKNQALSPLAMSNLLWIPSEAVEGENDPTAPPAFAGDPGVGGGDAQQSEVVSEYRRWARAAYSDMDDEMLESLVPLMIWWNKEYGPPQHIDLATKLDEHGIEYRREALADFARDLDVPASLIVGGGSEDVNHWNAWMTKERFYGTCAPVLDRVTHQDLTISYLQPILRIMGGRYAQVGRFRVGYDPSDVIKKPDNSEMALRLWLAGLLAAVPTLEECGFDKDQLAGPADLERLAAVLSNFSGNIPTAPGEVMEPTSGLTTGPTTLQEGPPATPLATLAPYLPRALSPRDPRPAARVQPPATARAAAALNNGDGVMVSIDAPPEVAEALAVPDGEPAERMHVTLAHVKGDVAEARPELRDTIEQAAAAAAASAPPALEFTHVERFVAGDEGLEPVVLVDHHPEVYELRDRLAGLLDAAEVPYSDDHGFRCHLTLGYWPAGEGPAAGPLAEPVRWVADALAVHWRGEVEAFPFRAPATEQPVIEAASREVTPVERAQRTALAEVRKANRLLATLARIRRDAGRELMAAAEMALAEAVRLAGSRAKGRAKNKTPSLKQSVNAALDAGDGLRPFLGALGTSEADLLHGTFSTFQPRAETYLARAQREQREAIEAAGYGDSSFGAADSVEADWVASAAAFLAAALTALARQRIIAGTDTATLGGPGEVSGDVPAQLVAQSIGVAEGRLVAQLPENPDLLPDLFPTQDRQTARDAVARALRSRMEEALTVEVADLPRRQAARLEKARQALLNTPLTEYVWVHGFWASPKDIFIPHRNRNGIRTVLPENDPQLANPGPWPDPGRWPFYQPGDHLGCSCELIAQVAPVASEAVAAMA